ncbi:MSMEG_0570 family nitrogen starvation response protein [Gynuella sp.]|uniref:MSMEG_0570 family nitrogen starvation response protein n=1 Tax=Gynuella sp. TaxID=2969146 RepID=UPI003D11DB31
MPAVNFYLRWPDGKEEQCYSPSTVIYQTFKAGDTMPLSEFMQKAESALSSASERVKASYGYYCSSASDQLSQLKHRASDFNDHNQLITILSMRELAK